MYVKVRVKRGQRGGGFSPCSSLLLDEDGGREDELDDLGDEDDGGRVVRVRLVALAGPRHEQA